MKRKPKKHLPKFKPGDRLVAKNGRKFMPHLVIIGLASNSYGKDYYQVALPADPERTSVLQIAYLDKTYKYDTDYYMDKLMEVTNEVQEG